MIKKEFREIIVPALLRLSILVLPLPLIAIYRGLDLFRVEILKMLTAFLAIATYWIANHYGMQAFKPEFRDRAMEYLLSFPLSRGRLLFLKLVPRLTVLGVLVLVYEISVAYLQSVRPLTVEYSAFPLQPAFFPLWVVFFLGYGFVLGLIEQGNLRALLNFVILILFAVIAMGISSGMAGAGIALDIYQGTAAYVAAALLVLTILGVPFAWFFKKFDLRAVTLYPGKIIYRGLVPLVVLGVAAVVLMVKYGVR